jgi:hypothetical protein
MGIPGYFFEHLTSPSSGQAAPLILTSQFYTPAACHSRAALAGRNQQAFKSLEFRMTCMRSMRDLKTSLLPDHIAIAAKLGYGCNNND